MNKGMPHGLADIYGEFALFETMLLFEDSLFLFCAHLKRLHTSALALGFPCHHLESFLHTFAPQDSHPHNMPRTLANSLSLLAEYNGIDRTELTPLLRHARGISVNLWSPIECFGALLRHANIKEHTPLATHNPSLLRLTLARDGTLSYSLHALQPITNTTISLEIMAQTNPLANHKTTKRAHFESAAARIECNSCFDVIYTRCVDSEDLGKFQARDCVNLLGTQERTAYQDSQDSVLWSKAKFPIIDITKVSSLATQERHSKDLQNHLHTLPSTTNLKSHTDSHPTSCANTNLGIATQSPVVSSESSYPSLNQNKDSSLTTQGRYNIDSQIFTYLGVVRGLGRTIDSQSLIHKYCTHQDCSAQSSHDLVNLCEPILTEGSRSNIIVACANGYYTPPASVGILAGTLRNALIEEGICSSKILTQSDILRAKTLYCVNSVRGIIPVTLAL